MRRQVLLIALLAAGLAACVGNTGPESCDATEVSVEVAVGEDSMTPTDPGVCRGQSVTMIVDASTDGVFHIHGYDAAVPATEITAGEETRLTFVADRSGQFPIELHPGDDPTGIGIGVFTVYEP
jgi:hypothetical protein